jgi:hypothetical protein
VLFQWEAGVNVTLNKYLLISAKHAVNAALLSIVQIIHDPKDYNFHNWHGLQGIAVMVLSAIGAREFVVWFPKLLSWSADVPQDVVATVETTTTVHPTDPAFPDTKTKSTTDVMGPVTDKPKP